MSDWKKVEALLKPEVVPVTRILPSGWIAMSAAGLVVAGAGTVMTSPPVPKPVSRLPFLALYRARANSSVKPIDGSWTVPATTMALVPGSIPTPATDSTRSEPKPVVTRPPAPNVASRLPFVLRRATPKSAVKPLVASATVPASTAWPLGWRARPTFVEKTVKFGPKLKVASPAVPKVLSGVPFVL